MEPIAKADMVMSKLFSTDWLIIFGLVVFLSLFVVIVLFLLFRFTTVRKLKNNPVTQNSLGADFTFVWQSINIARALSLPKWLTDKIKKSRYPWLFSDADLLRLHTNKRDKVLAKFFYWAGFLFMTNTIILLLLNAFGAFD